MGRWRRERNILQVYFWFFIALGLLIFLFSQEIDRAARKNQRTPRARLVAAILLAAGLIGLIVTACFPS